MRGSVVTRPPIASRRAASSAPQRSTALLSVVGDSRRTSVSIVSSSQSRAPPPVTQPAPRQAQPAPQPAAAEGTPTEATLGVPIYPGSQFLASYDAGRGQRYYIFGSAAPFVDVVVYYRAALKQKGELVYDT